MYIIDIPQYNNEKKILYSGLLKLSSFETILCRHFQKSHFSEENAQNIGFNSFLCASVLYIIDIPQYNSEKKILSSGLLKLSSYETILCRHFQKSHVLEENAQNIAFNSFL